MRGLSTSITMPDVSDSLSTSSNFGSDMSLDVPDTQDNEDVHIPYAPPKAIQSIIGLLV
jgi:hypothetical protein